MSVLDRLNAAKRKYFPGQSGKPEEPSPEGETAAEEDQFAELGRQLRMNTQFTEDNVIARAASLEDQDERRERIAALRGDLEAFLEEVRSGLSDLEASMHTVHDKITEIEAYQNGRNGVLKDKLHTVETMLDRLQDRK